MIKPSEEIIQKVLNGMAPPGEAEMVAKWFATAEGQQYLSESMDGFFNNIQEGYEEIYVPVEIPTDAIWKKIEAGTSSSQSKKRQRTNNSRHIIFKIAAVLVPLFLIGGLVLQLATPGSYVDVYVAKGEQKQIILKDGTSVYLNSETKFSYPEKFGLFSRKVELDGEAYFDVKKNERKPFYIEMKNASIKVLGTAFNVKAYSTDSDIKVSLDNGRVNLITKSKKTYDLLPQETLTYSKKDNTVMLAKNQQTDVDSKWKDSVFVFYNTPLVDVIKTLNRSYNVQFVVENRDALSYSYTLTTEKSDIKDVLYDLEKISPVRFTLQNDTIKIQIK